MRSPPKSILFISGFSPSLRARDLAWEFERFGPLVRCDIPALRTASAIPYAFIEFRRAEDAENAYFDMHGGKIDGYRLTVDYARQPRPFPVPDAPPPPPPSAPRARSPPYPTNRRYASPPPRSHRRASPSPPPGRSGRAYGSPPARTSGSGGGGRGARGYSPSPPAPPMRRYGYGLPPPRERERERSPRRFDSPPARRERERSPVPRRPAADDDDERHDLHRGGRERSLDDDERERGRARSASPVRA